MGSHQNLRVWILKIEYRLIYFFLILNVFCNIFKKHPCHMESVPDTLWCLLFKCYCALFKRGGYYCCPAISSDISILCPIIPVITFLMAAVCCPYIFRILSTTIQNTFSQTGGEYYFRTLQGIWIIVVIFPVFSILSLSTMNFICHSISLLQCHEIFFIRLILCFIIVLCEYLPFLGPLSH